MLSFQQYITESENQRLLPQIARGMAVSGATIDDAIQFLPQSLNEGFFRRLGAAWRAFWNPDQELFTKQQVEEYLAQQTKTIMGQLQAMTVELQKIGVDKGAVNKILERMKAHFSGVEAALDASPEVDMARSARAGSSVPSSVDLPPEPGAAWDALQKIPGIQRSEALDRWWDDLPESEKLKIVALLGIKRPLKDVVGRELRKPLEDARAAGKI